MTHLQLTVLSILMFGMLCGGCNCKKSREIIDHHDLRGSLWLDHTDYRYWAASFIEKMGGPEPPSGEFREITAEAWIKYTILVREWYSIVNEQAIEEQFTEYIYTRSPAFSE